MKCVHSANRALYMYESSSCVSNTWSVVNRGVAPRKGGMISMHFLFSNASSIKNPLSGITMSFSSSRSKGPEFMVICESDALPPQASETNKKYAWRCYVAPLTIFITKCCIEYTSRSTEFELTTLTVIAQVVVNHDHDGPKYIENTKT